MTRKSDTAVFAGSFNPFTIGHLDIVRRALTIFDRVIVAVGYNEHKPDAGAGVASRGREIASIFEGDDRVEVRSYTGLTVKAAADWGCSVMVRGVRSVADFEYERNLADVNRAISGIETLLLTCDPQYAAVSSSMVRELINNGYDASRWIATPQNWNRK